MRYRKIQVGNNRINYQHPRIPWLHQVLYIIIIYYSAIPGHIAKQSYFFKIKLCPEKTGQSKITVAYGGIFIIYGAGIIQQEVHTAQIGPPPLGVSSRNDPCTTHFGTYG